MAIDRTGISSLETGASDITYSGNEGPKSPQEEMQIAGGEYNRVLELIEKVREGGPLSEEEKMELQGLIQTLTAKGIPVEQLIGEQQGRGGIQMASAADPMLEEEYEKYVFEMEEQGLQPMSFEEFRQQAVAGMADGGIARLGYANGQLVKPGPGRPGYRGWQDYAIDSSPKADNAPKGDEGPKYSRPDVMDKSPGQIEREVKALQDKAKTFDQDFGAKDYVALDKYMKKKNLYPQQDLEILTGTGEKDIPDTVDPEKRIDDRKFTWREKLFQNALRANKLKAAQQFGWLPSSKYGTFSGGMLDSMQAMPGWLEDMTQEEFEQFLKAEKSIPAEMQRKTKYDFSKYERGEDLMGRVFQGQDLLNKGQLTQGEFNTLFPGPPNLAPGEGGPEFKPDPCKGPNPPAWCTAEPDPDPDPDDPTIPTDPVTGTAIANQYNIPGASNFYSNLPSALPTGQTTGVTFDPIAEMLKYQYAADGGRIGYAGGGITDLRQGYFLGNLVKGLLKPFKGLARGVKKFSKSKAGKLAILAALGYGTGMFGGGSGMFGSGAGKGWLKDIGTKLIGQKPFISNPLIKGDVGTGGSTGLLGKMFLKKGAPSWSLANISPMKSILMSMGIGGLTSLFGGKENMPPWLKRWYADNQMWNEKFAGISEPSNLQHIRFAADGGRIGYAGGGNDEDHRAAALSAMYGLRKKAQEGGLMDMGGMEKDYRNEGGFVPIGGQARADDVPARLSKNEFVFTADAVRDAGGGDIDAGAEVMENVMENLEQGGQVSKESQGLEGARNMFATAQRLEGVL